MDVDGFERFVGRRRELAALEGWLDPPESSGPRVVEIAGEPGVGKSRLLAEFTARVRERGLNLATDLERFDAGDGQVCLLDDAHRLAGPAVDALERLPSRASRGARLVVLAYRPRQAPPLLLAALARSTAVQLNLTGLPDDAVDALVGDRLCGPHRRGELVACSGNPGYARILAAWCAGPTCCPGSPLPAADAPPPRSAAPVLAEFGALSPKAVLVGHAAAVVGDPFDPALLAEVADLSEEEVLARLDDLLAADLIRPLEQTGQLRFRHPMLRWIGYAAAPGGWRLGAHQRAADALRRRGLPAPLHMERTGRLGDMRSVTVLVDAARSASRSDPRMAAYWYAAAQRFLPDLPTSLHRRRQILAANARCSFDAGLFTEAAVLLGRYDELPPSQEGPLVVAELAECAATLALWDGRVESAQAVLRRALGRVPEHHSDQAAARLRVALAAVTPASKDATEVVDDAVLAAAGSGDPLLLAQALALHALVRLSLVDAARATRLVAESARLVDQQTEAALAGRLSALATVGQAELWLERYPEAVDHLSRCLAIGIRTGQWGAVLPALIGLGTIRLRQGRLAEARGYAERAVRIAETVPAARLLVEALLLRAHAGFRADDARRALALWPGHVEARLALLATGGDESPADLAPLCDELPGYRRVEAYELLVRADDGLDRPLWAKYARGAAGPPGQRALAALAEAQAAEDPGEALHAARQALDDAVTAGHLIDAARARLWIARSLALLGEPGAEAQLTEAEAVAHRCGAPELLVEVAAERRRTRPELPRSGLDLLSPREHQVAALVSQGRTNRQVARVLRMSHKTVETHLSRIFAKLAVSSRAEVANLVGRAESTAPGSREDP